MIYLMIGIAIGIMVSAVYFRIKTVGVLLIDTTNEEKDIYRFDVKDLEKLKKHRSIVLKVNPKADLSQK